MRRSKGIVAVKDNDDDDGDDNTSYFTYRPLSNLPTPPPTSRQPRSSGNYHGNDDGEILSAVYRGPAIHLVNLIPSSASLAPASVPLVQSILSRANLPLETIALAVCVLDRLDAKFGRKWRLVCPLRTSTTTATTTQQQPTPTAAAPETTTAAKKRHSLPPASSPLPNHPPQLHIDAVRPEIIVLAALVVADKFADDAEQTAPAYCAAWGRGLWSPAQLNATERAIVEGLDYRIVPLAADDCLADAMVDMQLAGRQPDSWDHQHGEPTPPHSDDGDLSSVEDCRGAREAGSATTTTTTFVAGHARSKTMVPASGIRSASASVSLGLGWATAV
ncbi:hypothetical protein ISF_05424 [Cordyceps fumosorosea ARSEF 2679]|uniref:Cyclin n=1 Tax=Cordyceps fumosorosea (strain ARSEF 2679) TaxID=1081104 RepID=A0A167U8Z3_CORFA|nr:hypothetical protein ISF_05424 [Cordyceps fumosorosea ARSEF 2679]OAA61345.1 hypothetical protein ISF_05424 [Cordyceps fumosorosea ARSEF 2679]